MTFEDERGVTEEEDGDAAGKCVLGPRGATALLLEVASSYLRVIIMIIEFESGGTLAALPSH